MNKDFQAGFLIGLLMSQFQRSEELIATQKEIIKLQKQVIEMTPPQPEPEDIFFHLQTGLHAQDAAASNDLKTVEAYQNWVFNFTRKYVRPYVNQRVYQEVSVHMLRGVADRLGHLDAVEHEKRRSIRVVEQKRPPAGVN